MRSGYSVSKVLSFCGLTLGLALASYPVGSDPNTLASPVLAIFRALAWVAVAFCLIRGGPVILSPLGREVRELRASITPEAR